VTDFETIVTDPGAAASTTMAGAGFQFEFSYYDHAGERSDVQNIVKIPNPRQANPLDAKSSGGFREGPGHRVSQARQTPAAQPAAGCHAFVSQGVRNSRSKPVE
jgi:hypothetical protein